MSQTLRLMNFASTNLVEIGSFKTDHAAGVTELTLDSTQGLASDDKLLLGHRNSEQVEIQTVASVTDIETISIAAATNFIHNRKDPVHKLFGDKIRIYRAANVDGSAPADNTFTELATISIDPDQTYTDYTDLAGGSSYWYKYVYYNSSADQETALASQIARRGGTQSVYTTIAEVRSEAGFTNNKHIEDSKIASKIASVQSLIDSTLSGTYAIPFTQPINPLINLIATKLSAGYLMLSEYGSTSPRMRTEAQAKIDEAMEMLGRIDDRSLVLTGMLGEETDLSTAGTYSAWPNETTAFTDTENGGGATLFRIGDRY